jgi:hypothetical protein
VALVRLDEVKVSFKDEIKSPGPEGTLLIDDERGGNLLISAGGTGEFRKLVKAD